MRPTSGGGGAVSEGAGATDGALSTTGVSSCSPEVSKEIPLEPERRSANGSSLAGSGVAGCSTGGAVEARLPPSNELACSGTSVWKLGKAPVGGTSPMS